MCNPYKEFSKQIQMSHATPDLSSIPEEVLVHVDLNRL
jgi:hypothetical protein